MLIQSRDPLDPELAALVAIHDRELAAVTTFADDLSYLVAVVDQRVVACLVWRPGLAGAAEVISTYVRPAYRGRGITRPLYDALEAYRVPC